MEFRERLYQLRKGRGISQEELAHTVGGLPAGGTEVGGGGRHPRISATCPPWPTILSSVWTIWCGESSPKSPQPLPLSRLSSKTTIQAGAMSSAAAAPSSACRWCISTYGIVALPGQGIIAIGNVASGFLAIGGFPPACCPSAAWVSDY